MQALTAEALKDLVEVVCDGTKITIDDSALKYLKTSLTPYAQDAEKQATPEALADWANTSIPGEVSEHIVDQGLKNGWTLELTRKNLITGIMEFILFEAVDDTIDRRHTVIRKKEVLSVLARKPDLFRIFTSR